MEQLHVFVLSAAASPDDIRTLSFYYPMSGRGSAMNLLFIRPMYFKVINFIDSKYLV